MGATGLRWLDPPPEAAWDAAEELLRRLQAIDDSGALTQTGAAMARYPLHPRLARLVIEAERRGAGRDGCALAALLSAGARLRENASAHRARPTYSCCSKANGSRRPSASSPQLWRGGDSAEKAKTEDLLIAILDRFPRSRGETEAGRRAATIGGRLGAAGAVELSCASR